MENETFTPKTLSLSPLDVYNLQQFLADMLCSRHTHATHSPSVLETLYHVQSLLNA